jgi:hypothetical protein
VLASQREDWRPAKPGAWRSLGAQALGRSCVASSSMVWDDSATPAGGRYLFTVGYVMPSCSR